MYSPAYQPAGPYAPELSAAPRDRATPRRERFAAAFVALIAVSSATTFAVTGSAALAAGPVLLTAAAYVVWILPLRHTALAFLFLSLTISIPLRPLPGSETAKWAPPLSPVYSFLVENLNSLTGIEALRFSGSEVIYAVLLVVAIARAARGIKRDSAGRLPGVNALYAFLGVAFVGVLVLEIVGLARGGDFRQSLWQFRQLFWLPILTGLFSYCLRGPRDLRAVAGVATAAACFKIAIGLYYMVRIAWPSGLAPESMTSHDDTVLYASVVAFWCAVWAHHPTVRRLLTILVPCAWVLTGIAVNNRRIAFVSLFASLFVLYLLLAGPTKRWINRRILFLLPVLGVYLMAGRNHNRGIFKPAALVMSVSAQDDASSKTRNIENFNLIQTLKPNKLLGTGWGHEYLELSKAYDISQYFAQYRYIAHNSVLWLLSIGGVVGFTMIWLPIPVGAFLAARSYRFARTPAERTAAATVLAVLVCYTLQAWGDMGTQGVGISLLVAWALAASGKLASATGAWPSNARLLT